jgi:hypothetical protein
MMLKKLEQQQSKVPSSTVLLAHGTTMAKMTDYNVLVVVITIRPLLLFRSSSTPIG